MIKELVVDLEIRRIFIVMELTWNEPMNPITLNI